MAKIANLREVAVADLIPYERNAKVHGSDQIEKLKRSIEAFGFLTPCLIDRENNLIAGHGRVMAAKDLGMDAVPCVMIEDLSEEERRAYILADNRLTELGGWDDELVRLELETLRDAGFDISLTGFDLDFDDEKQKEEHDAEENPTVVLPDSRILICSISAFGTDSEKFIELQMTQEETERLMKRVTELSISEFANKLWEALNGI